MTIVDNFTTFIKTYAIKDRKAGTAAQCMYDYCLQFGVPNVIYSDRDPTFQADFFTRLMDLLGIKKKVTTGYNPKANGLCEKSNGIVKNMLIKYINLFGGEWDVWLRELQYAYNSSIHTSTELMYGRKLRLPLDIVFAYEKENEDRYHSIAEARRTLSRIYEIVRCSMNIRQDVAATYYDKKVLDDRLENNSEVYVFQPRSKKFELRWAGPHIIRKYQHPSYLVEINTNGKVIEKWFTRDKLRRRENKLEFTVPNNSEKKAKI